MLPLVTSRLSASSCCVIPSRVPSAGRRSNCATEIAGWATYFYGFSGAVEVKGTRFGEAESRLLTGEGGLTAEAEEDTLLVAVLINPEAPVTRAGKVGR